MITEKVLILVLLELTLLHNLALAKKLDIWLSFNPCFIGTYSITWEVIKKIITGLKF